MADLLDTVKRQMHTLRQIQDNAYDKYVFSKILENAPSEEMAQGYADYEQSLQGFDVRSFEKTFLSILDSDKNTLDVFTDQFRAIPKYLMSRNNWDTKVRNIMSEDCTPQDKQGAIDALDRQRTRAHNGVISLFNHLNDYAKEHSFGEPYPHGGISFEPSNINHREDAAQALVSQSTLLELTNELIQEKFQETGSAQTTYDKYRTMSLSELYQVAKTAYDAKLPTAQNMGMEL